MSKKGRGRINKLKEDYFSKQKKIDFRRIVLVEDRSEPMKTKYSIQLKKGKLPNK